MTNKPMLSVELRALLERVVKGAPGSTWAALDDDRLAATEELRALLDKPVCVKCGGTGVVDDGELTHSAGGIPYECGPIKCVTDCPDCKPVAQHQGEPVAYMVRTGTHVEVLFEGNDWLYKYRKAGMRVTPLCAEQPAPVSALITDEQILETMRPAMISADGGYVFDTAKKDVIEAGRALLAEVARLNGVKPIEQAKTCCGSCPGGCVAGLNGVKP